MDVLTKKGVPPISESFDMCLNQAVNLYMNPLTQLTEKLHNIFNPKTRSIDQHHVTLNEYTASVIQQRRKDMENGRTFDDLLWHFMNVTTEDQRSYRNQELRDIMLTSMNAARDTTAATTTYVIYLLIMHPEVESKLLLEIEQFFPNGKRIIESDNIIEVISNMTYARAV